MPDLVPSAEITSVWSSGNRKWKATSDRYAVVALTADMRFVGRCYQVMAQSAIDKMPPGPKLDSITAGKFFGWKNVHKHRGAIIDKKQNKRLAKSQALGRRQATDI